MVRRISIVQLDLFDPKSGVANTKVLILPKCSVDVSEI